MIKEGICYHTPVLLHESIKGLHIRSSGVYVDVTFGGGGHTRGILECLGSEGRLFGFDQDVDAQANIPSDSRFTFVSSNFRYLSNFLRYYGVPAVDGIFADLGVSSHHLDDASRGFSFRFDGVPDMRMNNRKGQTAADILNAYPEEELARIFYVYGELKVAGRLASHIVAARSEKPIQTIAELLQIINPFVRKDKEKKILAQIFQSLRIQTNAELEALSILLNQSIRFLKPGGRLVIITYHSLEDRLVKNFFRTGNIEGKIEKDFFGNLIAPLQPINNRVITPTIEEAEGNPRARSAKLRIAEKNMT